MLSPPIRTPNKRSTSPFSSTFPVILESFLIHSSLRIHNAEVENPPSLEPWATTFYCFDLYETITPVHIILNPLMRLHVGIYCTQPASENASMTRTPLAPCFKLSALVPFKYCSRCFPAIQKAVVWQCLKCTKIVGCKRGIWYHSTGQMN